MEVAQSRVGLEPDGDSVVEVHYHVAKLGVRLVLKGLHGTEPALNRAPEWRETEAALLSSGRKRS